MKIKVTQINFLLHTITDVLLSRIEHLNAEIQYLNLSSGMRAPKFGLDLLKSRKSNKLHSSTNVLFSLLSDGIHSGTVLSQYWLRRLVLNLLVPYCHIKERLLCCTIYFGAVSGHWFPPRNYHCIAATSVRLL